MWTTYQLFIATGMVVFGSINTLSTKWADKQSAPGSDGGEPHLFDHPFFQAVCMFVGEFLCLLTFKIWYYSNKYDWCRRGTRDINHGNLEFNKFVFLLPAMCDMTATSLMYIGLNFTYASSFQMLRGAVIVFTALLSVAFLRRIINTKAWIGIFLVISGLAVVGASDFIFSKDSSYGPNKIITGDLIIILAQVISATQVVLEEKFVSSKDIHPLQAVGFEGVFGMLVLGLLLIPMYFIPAPGFSNNPRGVLEDALDGLYQIGANPTLALAQIGSIFSIAFFNFFGLSVTKEFSATTRMVMDSVRTIVIWAVSIGVGWQDFVYLQVIGFVFLLSGTAIYNNLIKLPCLPADVLSEQINPNYEVDAKDVDEKTNLINSENNPSESFS